MIVVSFGVFACPLLVLHIHIIEKLIANHYINFLLALGLLHQVNKSCDVIWLSYIWRIVHYIVPSTTTA